MSLRHLGGIIDVHTGGSEPCLGHDEIERAQANTVTGHEVVAHWVHGAHVVMGGRQMARSTGNVVALADLTASGVDPLALRLVFLEHGYRQQFDLTLSSVEAAGKTLRGWREQVATWACEPSAPVSRPTVAAVTATFEDDLDTPAALRELRGFAQDPGIAPGAKFETFAHLDQLLGLDLAREVGQTGAGRTRARPGLGPPGRLEHRSRRIRPAQPLSLLQ